ncbi:MAG TPA: arginine--tRNA ligase [Candidatus Saccharimonadales bacterium]|nr:arginine--tRNA ligase [Candidatus Saccharimonadales bacterium]
MILSHISKFVAQTIEREYGITDVEPAISYPDPRFGDYATNVAFSLSGRLKKPPQEIAEHLAGMIKDEIILSAKADRGFINLRMQPLFWIERLTEINKSFGATHQGNGKKLQVEFISANPTGPLTLGNARGGYVGDVLARVLQHAEYDVTKEYYFNDAGTQIRILVESVRAAAGLVPVEESHYPGAYIKELAEKYRSDLDTKSYDELAAMLTEDIFEHQVKPAIDQMGIIYNEWFNERQLITSGEFDETIKLLQSHKLTYEKDGALWLASEQLGDERDRVLRKSNGDVTYLGTDIAYHHNIFIKRDFDEAIKIWGADHAGQVPSLNLTMDKLTPGKKLNFLILQWVRLMRGGKEVKMSKRAGTYVTVSDLLAEVDSDVARFFFLMRSADSHMDFDLDLAKERSQKNPLYYVMYSYARAHSILRQAQDRKLAPVSTVSELTDHELAVVRQMAMLPELIAEIVSNYQVHKLAFYGIETARAFHDLYESERIIDLDKSVASKRLYLIQQYVVFMEVYFQLMGITPISRMDREDESRGSNGSKRT